MDVRGRCAIVVGLICIGVLVLGACSSGSPSANAGDDTTTEGGTGHVAGSSGNAHGSPLKFFVDDTISSSVASYPEGVAGAKAAAAAINATGGIHGHPMQVVVCDNQHDPNQSAACAREAGTSGAFAATLWDVYNPQNAPLWKKSGVAPLLVSGNAGDYIPPYWGVSAGALSGYVAAPAIMKKAGVANVAVEAIDSPAATVNIPIVKTAAGKVGLPFAGSVVDPLNTTNFSPAAQKLKSMNAKSVLLVDTWTNCEGIIRAADQLGMTDVDWIVPATVIDSDQVAQIPPQDAARVFVVSQDPAATETSYPQVAQWLKELKATSSATSENLKPIGYEMWEAAHFAAAVAARINGPITKSTFLSELAKTKAVAGAVNGVTWRPNTPGPAGNPRLNSTDVYVTVVKNHQLAPYAPEPMINVKQYFG